MPRGYEVKLMSKPAAAAKRLRRFRAAAPDRALDERGKDLTTRQFAALLGEPTRIRHRRRRRAGCDDKKEAALLLRLSALTLPHALAQVVLCEQLYRAATLLTGHPYHRE